MKFKTVSSLLKQVEERITIDYSDTLFPLDWPALTKGRCPKCGCKLRQMRSGKWFCPSNKHRKRFVISEKTYQQLLEAVDNKRKDSVVQ